MRQIFISVSIVITLLFISLAYFFSPYWLTAFVLFGPLMLMGFKDMLQKKQSIKRNFPLIGRMRYVLEMIRPEIYQYFIESDTDGTPISRNDRAVIYQRAKKQIDTTPFGTQLNVYTEGYEWMTHSLQPIDFTKMTDHHPRVLVGDGRCSQPYLLSVLNVSAMSFGSLSQNAIEALNGGAKIGGFAHNTGEGGISPHHLKQGGDLIWQIGTGYFGARNEDGNFSDEAFSKNARQPSVKMIEIKLSQGAKPGHGGILPAVKNTPEVAAIRLVKAGTTVFSPPSHSAFSTPVELIKFIEKLRELSGGKPVGFKICMGIKSEFLAICKAMHELNSYTDFITIDGAEGGTGAAPPEFSNFVGMPLLDALAFADNALRGFGIRGKIKLIASGKVFTGFHIVRAIALGADACNSARAMMMALGCIQALRCNKNNCPTGVATQDPHLVKGLVVDDKKVRVANYHKNTVESFVELIGAAGIDSPSKIRRSHIYRRIFMNSVKSYEEIFPTVPNGSFLTEESIPQDYKAHLQQSCAEKFDAVA
ncbi:FMN-binding glutamate synthase family protein [Foetidibacter luteolus]|uniref:FMN-binding glutamate synthase family protein n=1 Tax=Foetidibacter luteolus TaxID=2608880 RepID=UPI00129AF603|nr:FMN-binding glutamate synthase family protein [Foetidibacter luteolus]